MNDKLENPPAFKTKCEDDPLGGPVEGMTLRDYFAAAALSGLNGSVGTISWGAQETAECAYRHADAMLKARQA